MSTITENFVCSTDSNTNLKYTTKTLAEILPFGTSREDVASFLQKYSIGKLNNSVPFKYSNSIQGKGGNGTEYTSYTPQTEDEDIYIVPMFNPNDTNNNISTDITKVVSGGTMITTLDFQPINASSDFSAYPTTGAFANWHLLDYNVNNIIACVNVNFVYTNKTGSGTVKATKSGTYDTLEKLVDWFKLNDNSVPYSLLLSFYAWNNTTNTWNKTQKIVFAAFSLSHSLYANSVSPTLVFNQLEDNWSGIVVKDLFFTNNSGDSSYGNDKVIACSSAFRSNGAINPYFFSSGIFSIYGGYGSKIGSEYPVNLSSITSNKQVKKMYDLTLETVYSGMYSNPYSGTAFSHMQGETLHLHTSISSWIDVLGMLYIPLCTRQENLPTTNTLEAKEESGYVYFPHIGKNGSYTLVSGEDIASLEYLQDNEDGDITLSGGHNDQTVNTSTTKDATSTGIAGNIPNLSTIGIFNTSYAISQTELNQFANYIWNTDDTTFDEIVENLKMFNNPLDAIIGIRLYPFDVTTVKTGVASDDTNIYLGRTQTEVSARKLYPNWYAKISMGELTYSGNGDFTDFEPFTKATLKLPYIGSMELPACYYVDKTIKIEYIIDITTGACTCQVYSNGTLFASMDGVCGIDVPISSVDRQSYALEKANNKIGTVSSLGSALGSALSGDIGGAIGGLFNAGVSKIQGDMIKADINKTSASTPTCSLWTPQNCYLIIEKTNTDIPTDYGKHIGYTLNQTRTLSDLKGFTTCINPILDDVLCTEDERNMLSNLLQTGVII